MDRDDLIIGHGLPNDHKAILNWMHRQLEVVKKERRKEYAAMIRYFPDASTEEEELGEFSMNAVRIKSIGEEIGLLPVIQDLIFAMGTKADVGMLLIEMFRQQDVHNALGFRDTIFLLNKQLRETPLADIEVRCPIGALLTFVMSTPAGFSAFLHNLINKLLKNILNDYYENWLSQPSSCDVLRDDVKGGWFTDDALQHMPDFDETYDCDPLKPHKGFSSFDAFFTRKLRKGARPVASPNENNVIVNPCENAPYEVCYSIKEYDAFWIKSQPYSLAHLLDNDPFISKFIGGTIYQGFLNPFTYHRLHAPVTGKVVTFRKVPGTYYSQPYYNDSKTNIVIAQAYTAHVAARAIIMIDTETDLGYVAFVPVGMVEVSTIDVSIKEGDRITKGDNIGTFRFGGSSFVLIFERGKQLAFDFQGIQLSSFGKKFMNVNSKLATFII